MYRCLSDSEKSAGMYVEAYDEAVDVYFECDLHAWGKLMAFHERFLLRAWEKPMPDWAGRD